MPAINKVNKDITVSRGHRTQGGTCRSCEGIGPRKIGPEAEVISRGENFYRLSRLTTTKATFDIYTEPRARTHS
ncbi:Hypothetical predicted protein, partial [Marmota monax]